MLSQCSARKLQPIRTIVKKSKLFAIFAGIVCSSYATASVTSPTTAPNQEFEWIIESVDGISRKHIHSGEYLSPNLLQSAYEANSYRPLWSEKLEDPKWLNDTLTALKELRYDALPTTRYHISDINKLRLSSEKQWLLDMRISDAIITAINDLNGNLIAPELLGHQWKLKNEEIDTLALLEQIKRYTPVSTMLESQRPSHSQYSRLRSTLKELLHNPAQNSMLADGEKLVPGDSGERVYHLAQRLAAEGLLNGYDYDNQAVYDENLASAVMAFQKLRGLKADGIVGGLTRTTLNTSSDAIALKVSLNLQRWRAAPKNFPDNHILVNTAAYKMELHDNGEKTLEMDVIVGKKDRQTPSFTESMTLLVLNPNWNIPKRITKEEFLPKLRDDPDYAKQRGIRALIGNKHIPWSDIAYEEFWADEFPYRLQQTASKSNALGRYKFMFPNPYLVYLHDTPYKSLFAKHKRAYSHGCVRLAEPDKLANYILAKKGWSESKVKRTVKRGKRKMIALGEPLQIYVMYLTSWVNDEGTLELYPDVYRQDKQVEPQIASILKTGESDENAIFVANFSR